MLTFAQAQAIAGSLGYPSKMPGTSYGISAKACIIGAKLAKLQGSVCYDCYALGYNYSRPSVAKAHAKRLQALSSPLWVQAMVTLLTELHRRGRGKKGKFARGWHRWHDSGDLQSIEHLVKICAVAKLTPRIKHWLPTRELGMVVKYRAMGGAIPRNLTVRVSATMVDGPVTKAWPQTSAVHNAKPAQGFVCPAYQRGGKCGSCRQCWDRSIKTVSYGLH